MELSKIIDTNEQQWKEEAGEKLEQLIEQLNTLLNTNLYEISKKDDSVEVFEYMRFFLFVERHEEFYEALRQSNLSIELFEKELIYSLMLTILRRKNNTDFMINALKKYRIIEDVYEQEDEEFCIETKDYGVFHFRRARSVFKDKTSTEIFSEENLRDGCHQYSEQFLKSHRDMQASTGICIRLIVSKYYHSVIVDKDTVIDVANDIILSLDDYLNLCSYIELNRVTYEQFIIEEQESREYDKSNNIYSLLKNTIYKQEKGQQL